MNNDSPSTVHHAAADDNSDEYVEDAYFFRSRSRSNNGRSHQLRSTQHVQFAQSGAKAAVSTASSQLNCDRMDRNSSNTGAADINLADVKVSYLPTRKPLFSSNGSTIDSLLQAINEVSNHDTEEASATSSEYHLKEDKLPSESEAIDHLVGEMLLSWSRAKALKEEITKEEPPHESKIESVANSGQGDMGDDTKRYGEESRGSPLMNSLPPGKRIRRYSIAY